MGTVLCGSWFARNIFGVGVHNIHPAGGEEKMIVKELSRKVKEVWPIAVLSIILVAAAVMGDPRVQEWTSRVKQFLLETR